MASVRVHKYMIVRSKRDQSSSSQLYLDNLSARQFSSHRSVQLGPQMVGNYPFPSENKTGYRIFRAS